MLTLFWKNTDCRKIEKNKPGYIYTKLRPVETALSAGRFFAVKKKKYMGYESKII